MRDVRSEIERLKSDVRLLQGKMHKANARLGRLHQMTPYQHLLVEADDDIKPDEEGACSVVWRLGKTPGYDDRELKKRGSYKVNVYNHTKTNYWKDERFSVAVDVWGDYYRINGFMEASFFLVPDGGIPAAAGKFSPGGTDCQRYYFDKPSSHIDPVEDPSTGGPVFEFVWNHTESQIAAGKVIQAKKIDGEWFVDVEPC